jgi:GNAT superfamily N-acetyltransferase
MNLPPVTFQPVTLAEWPDLQQLFTARGPQNGCWCMYWRQTRTEFHSQFGEDNRAAMQSIIESGRVPGILAYLDGQPVGWCSIAPREEFPSLDRSSTLRRVDEQPVWSIVCFFVAKPYRQAGLTRALIEAAITYAKENGARIVEAYPVIPESMTDPRSQLYTGALSTFENLGFKIAARRSPHRVVVRYSL